jgi:hypothetical protein
VPAKAATKTAAPEKAEVQVKSTVPANLAAPAKQQWRRGSNSKVSSGSSNVNKEAAKVAAPSMAAVSTKVAAPAHQS